ncbi:MAG: LysM peptidoglycan-binding domain-containing protein [Desulfatitalea sp.]|nr:LysM peptidoglycan-binding domain-containing protein [Desulfatitalea sp.]
MKKYKSALVYWILATTFIFPVACGRSPAPQKHPAAASRVAATAPTPEPLPDQVPQPKSTSALEPGSPSARTAVSFVHQVNAGETLGMIARWYTGREGNWRRLVAANPGIRPERLQIGTRIHIPENLLIRREAMPRPAGPTNTRQASPPIIQASPPSIQEVRAIADELEQIDTASPGPSPQAPPVPTPPPAADELFGPIERMPPPDLSPMPLELETLE